MPNEAWEAVSIQLMQAETFMYIAIGVLVIHVIMLGYLWVFFGKHH